MGQVTIKDIARICGVGVSTVSRAMNNHPDINEATKQKVQQAIKDYNYVPNNSARNLKRLESNTIAVLVKGIYNAFVTDFFIESAKFMKKSEYSVYLQQVDVEEDEVEVALELVKEKRLKGIVFLGGYFNHVKEKLDLLEVPFVMMTVAPEDGTEKYCSSVYVDDEAESFKMVDYLCRQGHKRIALITTSAEDRSIGHLRANGYYRALAANGLEHSEDLIRRMKTGNKEYSIKTGYDVTKSLLEDHVDFTAIYACSDYAAIGACKAVFETGRRVPEDYSIAGYDGLEIGKYYIPQITTIEQPIHEMIKKTLDILMEEMQGQVKHQKVVFDGKLLIGGSVAAID